MTGVSKMKLLVAAVSLLALCAYVNSATVEWCYDDPSCDDATWPFNFTDFCNGTRQSPINIDTSAATESSDLTEITITNLTTTGLLDKLENTGRTLKVTLRDGIVVSGGNLPENYQALQFHLHWGNRSTVPGSEHTLDGVRFAGELHIVTLKQSHNGNTSAGIIDPEGFAALGYWIEESDDNSSAVSQSWRNLFNLTNLDFCNSSVSVPSDITLGSLIDGVNHSSYYRYLGSLTTPSCYESVIWTVFKDTIKISRDVIDSFATIHIGDNDSTPLMVNVYRSIQSNVLPVSTQREGGSVSSMASMTVYSLWLIALGLLVSFR